MGMGIPFGKGSINGKGRPRGKEGKGTTLGKGRKGRKHGKGSKAAKRNLDLTKFVTPITKFVNRTFVLKFVTKFVITVTKSVILEHLFELRILP
jgi:hypothetical protein